MIRQYLGVLVLACLMAVIQTSVLPALSAPLFLDFLFVMVVVTGLVKDPVHGAIMCFLIGGIQDAVGGQITGFFMTARLLTFFAAQYTRSRLAPDTALSQATIGLGLGAMDRLVVLALFQVFVETDKIPHLTIGIVGFMILGTALNAILTPLFFQVFKLVPGFIVPRRGPRLSR